MLANACARSAQCNIDLISEDELFLKTQVQKTCTSLRNCPNWTIFHFKEMVYISHELFTENDLGICIKCQTLHKLSHFICKALP